MASIPRSRRETSDQNSLDLLHALIEAPAAPRATRPVPVALRSLPAQRDHALRGFLRRTWVDHLLRYAERALVFAALVVFCGWATDGPLRDWLHAQEAASAASAPPAPSLPRPEAPVEHAALLLPYTTPQTPVDDGFLEPRPAQTAPQVATKREPARLIVPTIGLDTGVAEVFVVDGVWQVADYAAGFLHGTALPGDQGNTVLAGHAGIRGAVFRDLPRLAPGDDLFLDSGGWRFHYRVRQLNSVWPDQVEVLHSRDLSELTLITCTNWDTQRLVVSADLLDSKPTPAE